MDSESLLDTASNPESTDDSEELDRSDIDDLKASGLPLYEGSTVDLNTAIGSILEFYISNSLSKQSLNDLLKLIDSFLPSPNLLPKTKYKLDQFILNNAPPTKHL